MKKAKSAPLPKAPNVPRLSESVIRRADAIAAKALEAAQLLNPAMPLSGKLIDIATKRQPKRPSAQLKLAFALLHQWLSYRSDLGQASADHFYQLRYYTAQLLGADHKRILTRRPDCSRVEV